MENSKIISLLLKTGIIYKDIEGCHCIGKHRDDVVSEEVLSLAEAVDDKINTGYIHGMTWSDAYYMLESLHCWFRGIFFTLSEDKNGRVILLISAGKIGTQLEATVPLNLDYIGTDKWDEHLFDIGKGAVDSVKKQGAIAWYMDVNEKKDSSENK